eukprot:7154269-Pyramimonas_sp.AAC.1
MQARGVSVLTDTPRRWMKTLYPHHYTLAYMAATNQLWEFFNMDRTTPTSTAWTCIIRLDRLTYHTTGKQRGRALRRAAARPRIHS